MSLLKKKTAAEEPEITYQQLKKEAKAAAKEAEKNGEAVVKQRKSGMSLAEERAAVKATKEQRKVLKKDLRRQGIKKRSDFEIFADEVGLSYPEGTTAANIAKLGAKISTITGTALASLSVVKLLLGILIILALVLYTAYVTEEKGHFTVNVTADMLENGFQISPTQDFSDDDTRLFAEEITNANATSINAMNRGLHEADGAHNGPGYMAYTFYLKNNGEETTNYGYTVNILSETLGTGKATWVMFYEGDARKNDRGEFIKDSDGNYQFDSHQIIYARAQDDGRPESLFGYDNAPFKETAYDPDAQYYTDTLEGRTAYGIKTTPFLDDYTALQGFVEDFEPGEVKKYTVIVWLEGDDPDCNNSILGGHVGFNVQFERLGEDPTAFFKGLFRVEYDNTYWAENVPDTDTGYAGTGEWADEETAGSNAAERNKAMQEAQKAAEKGTSADSNAADKTAG